MSLIVEINGLSQYTVYLRREATEWVRDGNVVENPDGTYSTQDAQYRNRLPNAVALLEYFKKEFLYQ